MRPARSMVGNRGQPVMAAVSVQVRSARTGQVAGFESEGTPMVRPTFSGSVLDRRSVTTSPQRSRPHRRRRARPARSTSRLHGLCHGGVAAQGGREADQQHARARTPRRSSGRCSTMARSSAVTAGAFTVGAVPRRRGSPRAPSAPPGPGRRGGMTGGRMRLGDRRQPALRGGRHCRASQVGEVEGHRLDLDRQRREAVHVAPALEVGQSLR